jgi:hypothetical protein
MLLSLRRTGGLLTAALLTLAACKSESEPGIESGADYYPPPVLGDYRIFDVVDSVWENSRLQPVSHFQFRERVAERIKDARDSTAYRIVRSRRALPTDPWRDDSVFVISPGASTVQLTRNNRRTVELVFPVRDGRTWNRDAFNVPETGQPENRRYLSSGVPFEARANGQTFRYEQTVTTDDVEDVAFDNPVTSTAKYRQVYAKGSGPVFRQRRRLEHCTSGTNGSCDPAVNVKGQTRTEVLLEKGNTP